MTKLQHRHWKIRRKMLILAVIPLALITSLLTGYFIWSSQTAVEDLFIQEGKDISRYLAKVTEFYMFSGDTDTLDSIGQAVLTENNVKSVTFYEADGKLLTQVGQTGPTSLKDAAISQETSLWLFQQPILYNVLEVDDFSTTDAPLASSLAAKRTLGWVQISVSEQLLLEKQRRILFTGIMIAGLGLIISILMAIRLGRAITRPLFELSNTVQQLEAGKLTTRAPPVSGHEFRILAQGLNRMAERIEHANEELQQRIKLATKQLSETLDSLERQNQELEKTRNELITADRAKDEFLARMSHELRTPLTSIIGYSELLEDMGLASEQEEFNHIIQQSSDLLLSIINDILDLTKLRSNAIELEMHPFNLEECMEDVVAMHAPQAFSKGLELVLFIESDVPIQLIGDALRLRQIVNNLISNAIKFTEKGEVIVFVSVEAMTEQAVTLNLQVKDSGIGIREQDLNHLFKEFSQANVSISRRFGGSGLGLVIVKRLAQLMHGDAQLTSDSGKGVEANCQVKIDINHSLSLPNPLFKTNPGHLLIYDQNIWSLKALRHHALKSTTDITCVSQQSVLWQKLQQTNAKFSALIIGLSQEEMHEGALLELLGRIRDKSKLPILLIGASAIFPLKKDCPEWHQHQPLDFISKPTRSTHFTEHLGALVSTDPSGFNSGNPSPRQKTKPYNEHLLHGANILIAEDNAFNRQLIVRILTALGAQVFEANNGAEALALQRIHPIDIFLLDLNMPEVDGYETATLIRQNQPAEACYLLIALTAGISGDLDQNHRIRIFDETLYKPIHQELLAETLAEFWHRQKKSKQKKNKLQNQPLISIPKELLKQEIFRLADKIKSSLDNLDRDRIKLFAHQLLGIIDKGQYAEISEVTKKIEQLALDAREESLNQQIQYLLELLATSFND